MVILLALCIPLTAVVVGFLTLKSVQLGLRWQIQTTQHKPPELKIPNPIAPIIEAKQTKEVQQQEKDMQTLMDEWMNGPVESR
jgi:hypothetical protein